MHAHTDTDIGLLNEQFWLVLLMKVKPYFRTTQTGTGFFLIHFTNKT